MKWQKQTLKDECGGWFHMLFIKKEKRKVSEQLGSSSVVVGDVEG